MSRHIHLALPLLLLLFMTPVAAEDENLECADYITAGENDAPASGQLIGTQEVTETEYGEAHVEGNVGVANGGASGGTETSVTYYVGFYQMADGTILELDCRTYTVYD